jgi:hypothetical protein
MRKLMAAAIGGTMLAATLASGAAAQERTRIARDAILGGDLAKAERTLIADRRVYGSTPQMMLNLAAVYARSGRTGEATALYRQVLGHEDVLMDVTADRTASAHTIARAGLARLQPMLATR